MSAEITITVYRTDLIPQVERAIERLEEDYCAQVRLFHREVCSRYRTYSNGWLRRRHTRSDAELVEMTKSMLDSGLHWDSPMWDAYTAVKKAERELQDAKRILSSLHASVEQKVTMSRSTAVKLGAAERVERPQSVHEILSA